MRFAEFIGQAIVWVIFCLVYRALVGRDVELGMLIGYVAGVVFERWRAWR